MVCNEFKVQIDWNCVKLNDDFLLFRLISAVKCNDSPVVLETLASLGACFDCASKEEINKVLDLGVSPHSIIYANPTKPSSHIQFAAETNIKRMTVDNDFELIKIAKIFPNAE